MTPSPTGDHTAETSLEPDRGAASESQQALTRQDAQGPLSRAPHPWGWSSAGGGGVARSGRGSPAAALPVTQMALRVGWGGSGRRATSAPSLTSASASPWAVTSRAASAGTRPCSGTALPASRPGADSAGTPGSSGRPQSARGRWGYRRAPYRSQRTHRCPRPLLPGVQN